MLLAGDIGETRTDPAIFLILKPKVALLELACYSSTSTSD